MSSEQKTYFGWLVSLIDDTKKAYLYSNLLETLDNTPFRYSVELDDDRVGDAKRMRELYCDSRMLSASIFDAKPVSIFEVMVGLATRGEIHIMSDHSMGDRTGLWFWSMIRSLGLITFTDKQFDSLAVQDILRRFLDRDYESNGRGGLFTVNDSDKDLRTIDIWQQMCIWFGEILEEEGYFR